MKVLKNIGIKQTHRLKRLVLGCIFCAIISYNIGFSNKVFGDLLNKGSVVVEYEPDRSSLPYGLTSGNVIARLTGSDIDSITVTNNSGSLEYIFTKTGSFTFRYKSNDSLINIVSSSIEATVDWIDKTPPTCGVVYSTRGEDYFGGCTQEQYNECINGSAWNAFVTRLVDLFGSKTACIQQCSDNNIVEFAGQLTNEDVVATLTGCSEDIIVTNNGGSTVYTFTENGNFTFEFQDLAGNPGNLYSKVNGIDKILPECDIEYSVSSLTSGNVVAKLTGCNKTLKNTTTSHTFTGNGTYKFLLQDTEGNTGEAKAKVNWIDKESPECTIKYNPSTNTTGEVLAILTGCNEKIKESETMFLFTDNGSYTFIYQDLVGNIGVAQADVNWILPDEALTGITHTITDNIITLNWQKMNGYDGDVDFYLWYEDTGEYKLLGKSSLEEETFSFNIKREGGHMLKIVPKNGGNIIYYSVPYENTHPMITPICDIEYPNKQPTNQDVIVKLTNCNEKVYVTNTDGGNVFHTFSDNGNFTFRFEDDLGNTGESTATVNWIDKISPNCSVSYSNENITTDPVIARIGNCTEEIYFSDGYGDVYTFTQNGKHIFYFLDSVGNIGTAEAEVSRIAGNHEGELSYAITGINHMENDGDIILTWDVLNGKYINIWRSYNYNEYILLDEDINVNTQNYSLRSLGTGHYSIKFVPQNNLLESVYSFDIIESNNGSYEEINCQITYSTYNMTSGDVIATLTGCNRDIIIDSPTHIFTGNGVYIFNFEDKDGNHGQKIAEVDWIDKTPPVCIIAYSTLQTTNHNVNATITCNDPNAIIKNNNSQPVYTFTGNGSFTFEVADLAGNTVSIPIQVSWIDKEPPTCTVSYSTRQQTTGEVIATLKNCSEQVFSIPGYNLYHRFQSNGSHTIIFRDTVGNIGSTRAEVNWIVVNDGTGNNQETGSTHEEGVTYEGYPITGLNHSFYNGNVILTWSALTSGYMDIFVLYNNAYLKIDTIHTNSELYSFETIDDYKIKFAPLDPNQKDVYYTISIPGTPSSNPNPSIPTSDTPDEPNDPIVPIDNEAPTCSVSYSTVDETSDDVIATLHGCSEEVTPLMGYGFSYIFTNNGNYIFYFVDNNGNIGTTQANVTWIKHIHMDNEINFAMTGISHFVSGNKINLTWTKLSNGMTDIYLWDFSNNEFEKLGSTNISNEEFLVDIVRTGEYLFKLVPENSYRPVTYFIYVDSYVGQTKIPVCSIVFNYENNNVVALLTGCNKNISVINNSGNIRHTFDNHENLFVFKYEDDEGYIGRDTAHIWYSENFDDYYNDSLIGKYAMNDYLVIHGINPSNKSITITGSNILLDNGGILESNVTCVLSSGNSLTINIDGLGANAVNDIIVPGNYAGYISYTLPKSFYANNMALNFDLEVKNDPNGSCIIDDVSIISKPNTVASTKKAGAKTGTDYKSQEIKISGLPENTAIPILVNIDYSDNVVQNYGKCVSYNGSNIDYCIGKYVSDLVLYKNGIIVTGGETVGQNGDIFQIKIKSSIYENSTITANLMFGHTRKSIISQFSVTTTGNQTHGSAEFKYDYSKFDSSYEAEWNEAYQYSYFYGITTKSSIKDANMEGNLTRIAMAKMMSNYAINVLGLQLKDYKQCSFNDVTPSENMAYDGGVINACKLGIMGINMPNNEFRPYDIVTRAEFATALSRLLYNTKDGTDFYYSTHIAKLKAEKIIKDTNPNLVEKKGYVMLMLMRSKQ